MARLLNPPLTFVHFDVMAGGNPGVNVGDSKVVNFGLIFLSDEQGTLLGSLLEYIKYPTPTKISVETMRRGMPINGLAQLLDMQITRPQDIKD